MDCSTDSDCPPLSTCQTVGNLAGKFCIGAR
jgi:hypothetical protein